MAQAVLSGTIPSFGILQEVDDMLALKVQVIQAELELPVIPAVAAGHRDAESVARATGSSSAGMRVLLDGLCALGLLRWSDDAYALTPTVEACLVPGTPTYCAARFLDDLRAGDHFVENIGPARS